MNIHTYGDSHSTFYGAWVDGKVGNTIVKGIKINGVNIKANHLGPKLAYSFGRDKKQVVKDVRKGDIVVFCLGEIDCRCQIHKYAPNWKESIDNIVTNYLETVKLNVEKFTGIKTCIFNVVPSLERDKPINARLKNDKTLPALGSDAERKGYTEYMNEKLREGCEENDYIFIDVYDKYCDEDGYLNRELSDANCHIRNPIYIKEFLKKNVI